MSLKAYKNLPRLFMPLDDISGGESAELPEGQLHYLRNVMRLERGDKLRVFNGRHGEWLAELQDISKKKGIISFVERLQEQVSAPDIWVLASPVKKEAFEWMIEKASELDAARFLPVLCDHTVVHRVNAERMGLIAAEAAEQSERLDIMQVEAPKSLEDVLTSWPSDRKLIFCLEREKASPLLETLAKIGTAQPLALLIGPEGGFSENEIKRLQSCPFIESVSLGPRVLKAETALVTALAGFTLVLNKSN